jgi:hypothetical protein
MRRRFLFYRQLASFTLEFENIAGSPALLLMEEGGPAFRRVSREVPMSDAEEKPHREAQKEQIRQSPMKKPETETAHAHPSDVRRATDAGDWSGPGAAERSLDDASQEDHSAPDTARHVRNRAMLPEDVHARGVDVNNDDTSDSTVDTDGKDRDAKRGPRPDEGEVISNASDDDATSPPPTGLAGIDSRPGGNHPAILPERGSKVTYEGSDETAGMQPHPAEAGESDEEEEHLPRNHPSVGHTISIQTNAVGAGQTAGAAGGNGGNKGNSKDA